MKLLFWWGCELTYSLFITHVETDNAEPDNPVCVSPQSIVEMANGETASITHIGTITLSSSLTLHNVLCVPSFTFNLLSVSTITKSKPCYLIFLSTFCFIQDLTCWRTIGVGQANDGLYLLQSGGIQQHSSTSLDDFLANHNLSTAFNSF